MQNNTVQTLIDYVKDITGQTEASDAKIVRALNFAVDHYSYLRVTSSGRWKWDSTSQSGAPVATATLSGSTIDISDFGADIDTGLLAIDGVDVSVNGKYVSLKPIDERDRSEPLDNVYSVSGVPLYYDIAGHTITVYPGAGTSYTVRLRFSRTHPRYDTASLSDPTGVDPVHEEYIALYAADRIMLGTNDDNRNAVKAELLQAEQEIKDLASKQDRDTNRRLKGKVPNVFMQK